MDQTMLIRAIVLVIAAGLWSSFAFILGPRLRKEQQHEFYACLTLAGIAFGVLILQFLSTDWLAVTGNATKVQAVAAVAQAAFTVAVIVLTIRTVQANSTMASETKAMAVETARMAKETERMAQAAVEQQLAAIRPVLVFRIHPVENHAGSPNVKDFIIEVINVGAGPALDTTILVVGPFKYIVSSPPVQPLAIAALESDPLWFAFNFEPHTPFVNPDEPLRWPRNAADAEFIRAVEEAREGRRWHKYGSPEQLRETEASHARWGQEIQYLKELLDRIDRLGNAGEVQATYADLSGNSHSSTAELLLGPHDWHESSHEEVSPVWHEFIPSWRPLTLGPLHVKQGGIE